LQYPDSRLKVTLTENNDNDNMGYQLTPAERYIHEWAKSRPDQPFCFLDFSDKYAHGTIRNVFSRLKKRGLIRPYCRSSAAFYVHSSAKPKPPSKPMTVTHTVGKCDVRRVQIDLGALLDSLDWEDVCRVHNIVLSFSVSELYDYCLKEHRDRLNKNAGDIKFGSFAWSRERILKIVLHRNEKVTSYLKCSRCPVEVSIEGLVSLAAFLGGVRSRLADYIISHNSQFEDEMIPQVEDWMVVQWHYGRDGRREISGPGVNVTFKTWCDELARIYLRNSDTLLKGRLELVEEPRKPLSQAFAEKIDPNFKR